MNCPVEPLKVAQVKTEFTEADLVVREFKPGARLRVPGRRASRRQSCAA